MGAGSLMPRGFPPCPPFPPLASNLKGKCSVFRIAKKQREKTEKKRNVGKLQHTRVEGWIGWTGVVCKVLQERKWHGAKNADAE